MSTKQMKRPVTLAIGIALILLGLFNLLDTMGSKTSFPMIRLSMIIAGLALVLFAFAKSGFF
jgi:uncharacterized membrane protein HdeD (DUF308 family)